MTLKIIIHDVGHGHSIHAFTPDNEVIVIDLGCANDCSPLDELKKDTYIIHHLVITHPHGDHIDEIKKLDNFFVSNIYRPNWLSEEEVRKANQSSYSEKLDYYFKLKKNNYSSSPSQINIGGVKITLHDSRECGTSNINNHSIVIVFEYHGVKVVIPGDNEPSSWKALLNKSSFVNAITGADVFLASHHGRESGYHLELLQQIKPKLCIVSDSDVKPTDARRNYSNHASGWLVYNKDGSSKDRDCLTTRKDGRVEIKIGKGNDGRPFLNVVKDS